MSFSLSQGASYLLNKFGPQDDDVENKKSTSNTAGSAADNPPQTPESRATDILRETKEKVLQFNRRGEIQFAQAKLPVGSDYGGKFNGIKLAAAETSGLYSGSGATSSSFSSDSADIKREDTTIQESARVRGPVMDPVSRHITSILSSDKAHDILSNPVKKTAYGLAFSSFTDKGIDINHEQLYQRVNNVHAEFTDKGWLGKVGDWLSSLGVKEANAATSSVKLDADSLRLANDIADRVVESLFELKSFSSYKEFEKYAITQININLNDPAELDYLKSSYELYKRDGEVKLSLYDLSIHKMGYKLDQFIKDNPRAVWSAKKTVSDIAYGSKKIGEGFSYVVGPWWDEFVKGVNYFIPDEVNEWVGEQASKGVESYKKWESKLTDKQRLIVDTAKAGGEVALDLSIIAPVAGGISKVAGSFVAKDITQNTVKITGEKVLKQTDDLLAKNADDVDVVKMEVGGKKADIHINKFGDNYKSKRATRIDKDSASDSLKLHTDKIVEVLQSKNPKEIANILKREVNWDINTKVFEKIPAEVKEWGLAKEYKKSFGIRLQDSNKADISIRIMKGDSSASHASQRVDYVKITYNGKVIGRDGLIMEEPKYKKPSNHPHSHIPLEEWLKWKEIGKK